MGLAPSSIMENSRKLNFLILLEDMNGDYHSELRMIGQCVPSLRVLLTKNKASDHIRT